MTTYMVGKSTQQFFIHSKVLLYRQENLQDNSNFLFLNLQILFFVQEDMSY